MVTWTPSQLHEYQNRNQLQAPQPQRAIPDEPLGKTHGEAACSPRFTLRITSFRARLIDPDNLCAKYVIDSLRYAKLLPDDTAQHVKEVIVRQEKCDKKEERTEIEITS